MAPWTLSPRYHRTIVAALRQVRLELAVATEEGQLRRSLSAGQRAGQECACCGTARSDLRPVAELDGVTLVACVAHAAAGEVA